MLMHDTDVLAWAVLVALALDWLVGEPPARWHPVVAMGRCLDALGRRVAPLMGAPARPFLDGVRGAAAWAVGALAALAVGWAVAVCLRHAVVPAPLQGALLGVFLKPLLAWRMLHDEVAAVEAALVRSLDAGRAQVARLVSRDTAALDEAGVRAAALSTLSENLNDSVLAPLFWFVLAGLPAAVLYRWANTADAMWGYRGVRGGRDWTWAGRCAARVDDVLSWLPARITAVLLLCGAPWRLWRALPGEARCTPSPNGGWPMGALALRLGVRLDKPGVYALNVGGRLPSRADTQRALRWCAQVVAALLLAAVLLLVHDCVRGAI